MADLLRYELGDHPEKYTGMCQCPACIARIQAVALNSLKPFYVTTVTGEVFGEYQSREAQNMSDIMAGIGRGIAEVIAHPPHP